MPASVDVLCFSVMKSRPFPGRVLASHFVSIAIAISPLAAPAWGQATPAYNPAAAPMPSPAPSATLAASEPASPLTAEQRVFFRDLALLNARQISLASEASGRATSPATRDFAAWIIREHQTFAEELATLAKKRGDEVIVRVEAPPIKDRPAWANRDDTGYDEGYLRAVIEVGRRISDRLEAVSKSPETAVAAFAQKQLPGLASRIARAQDLQKEL
jgi:predicted outer membrane protein